MVRDKDRSSKRKHAALEFSPACSCSRRFCWPPFLFGHPTVALSTGLLSQRGFSSHFRSLGRAEAVAISIIESLTYCSHGGSKYLPLKKAPRCRRNCATHGKDDSRAVVVAAFGAIAAASPSPAITATRLWTPIAEQRKTSAVNTIPDST